MIMTTNSTDTEHAQNSELRKGITRRFVQIVFQIVLIVGTLFISSGKLDWNWAWLYIGVYVLGIVINASFMLRTRPELIAERAGGQENVKGWDRVIVKITAPVWIAMMIITGLDERWGWSPEFSRGLHWIGFAIVVVGNVLVIWAMLTNAFFSSRVRIQYDRGHTVVTDGPYRFVRHPGYTGFSLSQIGLPIMLGSLWGLIPGVMLTVAIIVRTILEDRTLQEELDGYRGYAERVRYRLLPGIW
jgi:protein-S-isoprenylcysteine O-methyltransferase Ste14